MASNITALDAVRIYFGELTNQDATEIRRGYAKADTFLAWLWDAGFKAVPLDGNEDKQKPS